MELVYGHVTDVGAIHLQREASKMPGKTPEEIAAALKELPAESWEKGREFEGDAPFLNTQLER